MDQITQEGNRLAFDSIEQDIDALPPSIQPTLSSKPEGIPEHTILFKEVGWIDITLKYLII